jgi:DNA-3-methyladenine glycosylase I
MLTKEVYREIFTRTEANLIQIGAKSKPVQEIHGNLDKFKDFEGKRFSDFEYYRKLVQVVFYSGFKAATVSVRLETIFSHFPDYEIVAEYDEFRIAEIYADPKMIKNHNKIQACINNAEIFKNIVEACGSIQNYIDSFSANESFENVLLLKEELESKFHGLGRITTYHFLTDIGLPVLKPDRVICRIFRRLGLIENENQLLKTVIQGRKFAEATGLPIRYIDIIFVAYGQLQSLEFGINKGICLEREPSCNQCTIAGFCGYNSSNE